VKNGSDEQSNKDSSNLAEKIINTYNYVESQIEKLSDHVPEEIDNEALINDCLQLPLAE
jgi:hypothetical protein